MVSTTIMGPLLDTAFAIGEVPVTWLEILGFLTGVAAVLLAAARRIANWPVGILNSALFGFLFLDARLYGDAALQIVYIGLGVFGWWAWLHAGPQRTELRVTHAGARLLAWTAAGVVALTILFVPILEAIRGSAPFFDALTTAMSLGAQTLLCLKKIESWYLWIAVDLIYVPLYLSRDLYLTAAVYCVFLAICLRAVMAWRDPAVQAAPAAA